MTDTFDAALASPRTKRLDGCTLAVRRADDGSVDMLIHHGGLTQAAGFSAEQAKVLAGALGQGRGPAAPALARTPGNPASAPSGGCRPDASRDSGTGKGRGRPAPRAPDVTSGTAIPSPSRRTASSGQQGPSS